MQNNNDTYTSYPEWRAPAGVQHFSLTRTVAPADHAVSLEQAKCMLRLPPDDSDEDVFLETLIDAVTAEVENFLGRSIITQTWKYTLDCFPCMIQLPRPPLLSVASITYIDTDESSQTLSSSVYQVDVLSDPARIMEAAGQSWPSTSGESLNAVTVTYTACYGADTTDTPANIQAAILMMVNDLYNNREAQILGTIVSDNPAVARLLAPHKLPRYY